MIFLIIFITALVIIFVQPIRQEIENELVADAEIDSTVKTYVQEYNTKQEVFWDNTILTILAFLTIVVMISSYFIDTHPIFFIVFLVLLVLSLIGIATLSNAYIEISADADLAAHVAVYPKINWIMSMWPFVVLIQGVLVGIVLYVKFKIFDQ